MPILATKSLDFVFPAHASAAKPLVSAMHRVGRRDGGRRA